MKFGTMGKSDQGRPDEEAKPTLKSIVRLTEGLPKVTLEAIVVEAILKHRYLRDQAENWEILSRSAIVPDGEVTSARLAYVRAMIESQAQQLVLSTLLDSLGYIPDVGGN